MRLATVTLNGTLDRVMPVPEFTPGNIYSASDLWVYGSGKGLNVARVAVTLGGEVRATGLVMRPLVKCWKSPNLG